MKFFFLAVILITNFYCFASPTSLSEGLKSNKLKVLITGNNIAKNPTATAILFMALISFMMTKRVESWGWVTGIIMMAINEPIKKGEVSKPDLVVAPISVKGFKLI